MPEPSANNLKIPAFLRVVTTAECLFVAAAAFVLFALPALGNQIWAWAVPPYNSRYMGAIYAAALLGLVVLAATGRWAPGRTVVWMSFVFTLTIGVVMFFYTSGFIWTRLTTYAFWFLYIFQPLNAAFFLYRLRGLPLPGRQETPAGWRTLLFAVIVLLGLYGVGLLVAPAAVTAFWPWKIDAFQGRVYAATFITPALGTWPLLRRSAPSERAILGLPLLTLGVLSIVGVIWTSAVVPAARQVNYASLGTWVFFGMHVLLAGAGAALAWSARRIRGGTLPTASAA